MSIYRFLAVAVMAAAVTMPAAGDPTDGKPTTREKKAGKSALKGEYGAMAKVCDLTAEQQEKVQAALTTADADAKAQEAEFKKKLEAAQKALKDLQAQKPDRGKIVMAKVEEVLTPEQKAKYVGYRLYVATAGKYAKLNLTKEQKSALETFCVGLGADPEGKKKADEKALSLLTDEQKTRLADMSKPREKHAGKATTRPAGAEAPK
ncbi:MAG: hypothetical protein NTV86_10350 [Planctomycetota bacterium]|nr:hypothetical protein [Planctomycetota bacterium]